MKKCFGHKVKICIYNLRKGKYTIKIEPLKMGVKWKIVLVINSESTMINSERGNTP
jgi:hypothetical protein